MDDMNTVKCPLCRVDVPIDKIDLPNRCLHPQCPLKRPRARSLQSLSTPWAVISCLCQRGGDHFDLPLARNLSGELLAPSLLLGNHRGC